MIIKWEIDKLVFIGSIDYVTTLFDLQYLYVIHMVERWILFMDVGEKRVQISQMGFHFLSFRTDRKMSQIELSSLSDRCMYM